MCGVRPHRCTSSYRTACQGQLLTTSDGPLVNRLIARCRISIRGPIVSEGNVCATSRRIYCPGRTLMGITRSAHGHPKPTLIPVRNGFDLCRRIEEQSGHPPCSGHARRITQRTRKPHRIEGITAAADDFLTKPSQYSSAGTDFGTRIRHTGHACSLAAKRRTKVSDRRIGRSEA